MTQNTLFFHFAWILVLYKFICKSNAIFYAHGCPCHMFSSLNHLHNCIYLSISKKYLHLQGLKALLSSTLTFDTNNKPQMQQFPLGGAQDLFLSSLPCMNLPITPYLILDGSHSWPLPCNINALSSLFWNFGTDQICTMLIACLEDRLWFCQVHRLKAIINTLSY